MRFHLTIDCDNAAFRNSEDEVTARELCNLLRTVAKDVALDISEDPPADGVSVKLRDSNGNTVGRYWWSEDSQGCTCGEAYGKRSASQPKCSYCEEGSEEA